MKLSSELLRISRVECKLTAKQWNLYTSIQGSLPAADLLNRLVEALVQKGCTRTEFCSQMLEAMYGLRNYGAYGTEPRWVLDDIMDTVFGEE